MSQVTNKQTVSDLLFLELQDCNKGTTHSDTLSVFLQLQSWLCVGMFCKRTIFCVSYIWIHVLMSDYSDSESSDSDIPTSSRKQLQSSVVVVTSDSETSTIEEESSDNITSDVWCKKDNSGTKHEGESLWHYEG